MDLICLDCPGTVPVLWLSKSPGPVSRKILTMPTKHFDFPTVGETPIATGHPSTGRNRIGRDRCVD